MRRSSVLLLFSALHVAVAQHAHHHGAPLTELNETEVTMYHAPIPESYFTLDFDYPETATQRRPGLMMTHAVLMSLAFFVALPAGIAMRTVKHPWHKLTTVAFYVLCVLGLAANSLYKKYSPDDMYQGQLHSLQGYWILLFAVALTTVDLLSIFRRVFHFFRAGEKFHARTFWNNVILGQDGSTGLEPEYAGLVTDEPEDLEELKTPISPPPHKRVHYQNTDDDETAQWANDVRRHRRHFSQSGASETTVCGTRSSSFDDTLHVVDHPKVPLIQRIATGIFAVLERLLVFGGYFQVITGIVVYTGGCRENYNNGCLAHLIKGGIFFCYGLVSFARYLGSFSELGWAWNRAPGVNYPSAEFVESLVIFLYGISNTWMERFGAHPGDSFTTKQIEHIGIAVMFWFAGLLGMAIESKRVRRWLAASSIAASGFSLRRSDQTVAEPPSYAASFNPFPALVIGITGAAMAAHEQTYMFQVQIHELWGNLLVAWSVLRCLTYFYLWLGPPRSILPSRPPTEALGSFFLACGGLAFQFSTEELTIAAMRRGRDDVMMFTCVGVAITCFCLCWSVCVVGFKGYLRSRLNPRVSYHSSA
ncbi:hypothetical protein D9758_001192 [Tetrapyrgos nigripes]|uniref:Integral membrane protein n=1 Tax=Tetrapyrgos nigripes TaxID=182062 RepID=A0A8H5GS47_9AGAR|nr:hypothetical protein D9758_001192 [Tetrapyrgos nigripes]